MANMLKNIDLFEEPDDDSKWTCFSNGSVEVVKKIRDKEKEVKDFYDAQKEISKDVLPKQTTAEEEAEKTKHQGFATLGDVLESYLKKHPFAPSGESK